MIAPAPLRSPAVGALFSRLAQLLPHAAGSASPAVVHHVRTHIRRVEALLQEGLPAAAEPKLRKQLQKVRRRAGRVRDLDVQRGLLLRLQVEGSEGAQRRLLQSLEAERERAAARLRAKLGTGARRELRRRLRRAQQELQAAAPTVGEWERRVWRQWEELAAGAAPLPASRLHAFRLECKRLRYLAEAEGRALAPLGKQLKRVQDAIGLWHDWSELARRAEREGAGASPALLAALRNLAALHEGEAMRAAALARRAWRPAPPARRPPRGEGARPAAALASA
ncbi:MAG TPA: CHAD domain-containing protein [Terriglobales bacterium]|nr:CHAD domain-containing protein [Terriglobales bacterium]